MMNSEYINLIFAGVSALGALLSGIAALKARGTKKEMENTINKYRTHIRSVNDLADLEPLVSEISNLAQNFRKISSGTLPNVRGGKTKTERDWYVELKSETAEILDNIPSEYKSVRNVLNDIIDALSYCINSDKLFKDLYRNDIYSYEYVEKKYQDAIGELKKSIRDIKYLCVDE